MTDRFDIAVIGGGIHGVGVAQAAAAAGYSVRVLEQYPRLAQGTSSRSSKLIHGGLRYLETGQFSLVKECIRERETLLKNAPHLVKLKPFYIPVYSWSNNKPWALRTGLSCYALLGGLSRHTRFRSLKPRQWQDLDGLRTDGLKRVFQYFDAQSNDVALTHAVMRSASDLGADLQLNAAVQQISLSDRECIVRYIQAGAESECLAKVVINASGPWADTILKCVTPRQAPYRFDLVQGTHIVVPGKLEAGIYYVEAPRDRRAVFIIPWQGQTMVGTTEILYSGKPETLSASKAEMSYLLQTLGHYFPFRSYAINDVLDVFAGARVLPNGNEAASARPRETILVTDRSRQPRLISILGGKLTAYRITAQKTMQLATASLPARKALADTADLPLP